MTNETTQTEASESVVSTQAQHTPGPWMDVPTGPTMSQRYTQPFGVAAGSGANLICGCFGDVRGGEDVAEANARLIAAAPDMLEALKWMALNMKEDGHDYRDCFKAANRAIAKATQP